MTFQQPHTIPTRRTALLAVADIRDMLLLEGTLRRARLADEVAVATDGVEALEHLFPREPAPSMPLPLFVLLDMHLPALSGLAVLRRIRAEKATRLLPVVALTASQGERDLAECYSNGMNRYIHKPVDPRNVIRAVQGLPIAPLGVATAQGQWASAAQMVASEP
jgi:CheY-like chemotaxis protein